jgi:hypothetical protein
VFFLRRAQGSLLLCTLPPLPNIAVPMFLFYIMLVCLSLLSPHLLFINLCATHLSIPRILRS